MPPRYSKGDVIQDNWEIVEVLGEGFSAVVYAARSGLSVNALKIMHVERAREAQLRERFEREAAMLTRLNHRNLINVIGAGTTRAGEPMMIMEMLAGEDLGEILSRERQLEPMRALLVFEQLVGVLGFIHAQGVIHRDLKPENIMVVEGDGLKLLDFGISKNPVPGAFSTVHGMIMGTPMYMSPEQARGDVEHIDERSDLFAAGLILYEMLSGQTPRAIQPLMQILSEAATQPVAPLSSLSLGLPLALERFVDRMISSDPAERYGTAAEILDVLRRRVLPEVVDDTQNIIEDSEFEEVLAQSDGGAQTQLDELGVAAAAAQDSVSPPAYGELSGGGPTRPMAAIDASAIHAQVDEDLTREVELTDADLAEWGELPTDLHDVRAHQQREKEAATQLIDLRQIREQDSGSREPSREHRRSNHPHERDRE